MCTIRRNGGYDTVKGSLIHCATFLSVRYNVPEALTDLQTCKMKVLTFRLSYTSQFFLNFKTVILIFSEINNLPYKL